MRNRNVSPFFVPGLQLKTVLRETHVITDMDPELVHLNKRIRNARERLKRAQRQSEPDCLPTPAVALNALLVYIFSNNLEPAHFLVLRHSGAPADLEGMRALWKGFTQTLLMFKLSRS